MVVLECLHGGDDRAAALVAKDENQRGTELVGAEFDASENDVIERVGG